MVETASYFVSICYAPWLLKSYLSQKVLVNNLAAFKTIFEILVNLFQSLIHWHSTQELVLFSVAYDDMI